MLSCAIGFCKRRKHRECLDGRVRYGSRGRRIAGLPLFVLLTLFASVVVVLAWATPAQAVDLSASQMKVSIWPEYDDPRVLVINEGDLDSAVELPAQVSFNIPKGAEIGMACEIDSGGGHNCKTYQLFDKGDYQTLTYTVEKEHKIFMEYYYVAFPDGNTDRSFDFTFRPEFPIASFELEVQEPLRSTNFTVDPALQQVNTDSDGLKYYGKNLGALAVDQPLDVTVSYVKTDDNPSVNRDSSAAAATSSSGSGPGSARNTSLYAVIGVLAFGGVLFGSYRMLRPTPPSGSRSGHRRNGVHRSARKTAPGSKAPAKRQAAAGPAGSRNKRSASAGDVKYCPSCGAELEKQHHFCPECGTEQP